MLVYQQYLFARTVPAMLSLHGACLHQHYCYEPEELVELADKIAEVAAPTITATTTPSLSPQLLDEIQQQHTKVRQLQNTVRTLSTHS